MFIAAQSVFLKDLERTRDVQLGVCLPFAVAKRPTRIIFRCAAATFYRAYLNGDFIAHGPARTAHGFARVDEIDLTGMIADGQNVLAIEVAGYNLDCIYTTGDASFMSAEIVADGQVLAATSEKSVAFRLTQRLPAERFSHARCTGEVYQIDRDFFDWRIGRINPEKMQPLQRVDGPKRLLLRGVPFPGYQLHSHVRIIGCHSHIADPTITVRPIAALESDDYLTRIAALNERPATECAKEKLLPLRGSLSTSPSIVAALSDLAGPAGVDLDFGEMKSGFLLIDVEIPVPATVDLVFVDHLQANGGINPRGGDMNGVIRLHLPAGRTRFQAFEPHCLRYLRVIVRDCTAATIHQVGVIDYAYPDRVTGTFLCADGDLNRIYDSARLTLRLNTQDIFMDCPGRERAGWLCDSLFSGRAMQMLFGDLSVERAMLENFLHAPESNESPGYFPECYPGRTISGGNFIPNWSMFLAIELGEYIRRSGDVAFGDAYRSRIARLVTGIERSANSHGLLQELPGFTFVDWSAANANEYKRPISTATNALYARMLDALAALYQRNDWSERAKNIRQTLRSLFPDVGPLPDSFRHDGTNLVAGDLSSEAAQYYLYWTGAADAQGDAKAWWQRLMTEFGPVATGNEKELAPSNVFIGLYLRLEVLARQGEYLRLLQEMRALFLPMLARGPGTLWEHLKLEGSVCHGFASHAAVWLVRDILGIGLPDAIDRTVNLSPNPTGLAWASGTVLIDGQPLSVNWQWSTDRFALIATVPAGYTALLHLDEWGRQYHHCRVNGEAVDIIDLKGRAITGNVEIELS